MAMGFRPFLLPSTAPSPSGQPAPEVLSAMVRLAVCAAPQDELSEVETQSLIQIVRIGIRDLMGWRDLSAQAPELVSAALQTIRADSHATAAQSGLDVLSMHAPFKLAALTLIAMVMANETDFDPDSAEWNFYDDCSEHLEVDGMVAGEAWHDVVSLYFPPMKPAP